MSLVAKHVLKIGGDDYPMKRDCIYVYEELEKLDHVYIRRPPSAVLNTIHDLMMTLLHAVELLQVIHTIPKEKQSLTIIEMRKALSASYPLTSKHYLLKTPCAEQNIDYERMIHVLTCIYHLDPDKREEE